VDTVTILEILTNTAPPVVAMLVLAIVILYAARSALPAMEKFAEMQRENTAQQREINASWKALVSDQNRINDLLHKDLADKLKEEREAREQLILRIRQLEADLRLKDERIVKLNSEFDTFRKQKNSEVAALQAELETLRKADREKQARIDTLTEELAGVIKERDEMSKRMDAVEKKDADDEKGKVT
jgi:chromosome segregation ATPase